MLVTAKQVDVTIGVKNGGTATEKEILNHIFDPLKRGLRQLIAATAGQDSAFDFISCEVARAHGDEVTMRSDNGETVFTMRLPRGQLKTGSPALLTMP